MKTTALLITLSLALAGTALAGPRVTGNGGDVVVCKNENASLKSIELLDFYEARAERGIEAKLNSTESVEKNMQALIDRLGFHDHFAKDIVVDFYQDFTQKARFLPDVELVDIPDSQHISFPKGCLVQQIVIQKTPQFPEDARYTVSKDLWDRLDNANKAGLIMHELLYRRVIEVARGTETNSLGVRYMNSLIAADKIKDMDLVKYLETFSAQLGLGYTVIENIKTPWRGINFQDFSGHPESPSKYIFNNGSLRVPVDTSSTVRIRKFRADGLEQIEYSFSNLPENEMPWVGRIGIYNFILIENNRFAQTKIVSDQNRIIKSVENIFLDTSNLLNYNIGLIRCKKFSPDTADSGVCNFHADYIENLPEYYKQFSSWFSELSGQASWLSRFPSFSGGGISTTSPIANGNILIQLDRRKISQVTFVNDSQRPNLGYIPYYLNDLRLNFYESGAVKELLYLPKQCQYVQCDNTARKPIEYYDRPGIHIKKFIFGDTIYTKKIENKKFKFEIPLTKRQVEELNFETTETEYRDAILTNKVISLFESGQEKVLIFNAVEIDGAQFPYFKTRKEDGSELVLVKGDVISFNDKGQITKVVSQTKPQ